MDLGQVDQISLSGMTSDCELDTAIQPAVLTCSGTDLETLAVGQEYPLLLSFMVAENYDLLGNPLTGSPATPIPVSSHITTTTPEVTTSDNDSYDELIPMLSDRSSVA